MLKNFSYTPKIILLAVVFACSTLAIFCFSQNYGPESAIRRYHRALSKGDLKTAYSISSSKEHKITEKIIQRKVSKYLATGATWHRRKVVFKDKKAYAVILYVLPNQQVLRTMWSLTRNKNNTWSIDAEETVSIWQSQHFFFSQE